MPTKDEIRQINDWFENKTVETFFQNHRRLYVSQVNFDRTPSNTTKKCEKGTLSFLKYYSQFFWTKIKSKISFTICS
jgi:hypothetical protein